MSGSNQPAGIVRAFQLIGSRLRPGSRAARLSVALLSGLALMPALGLTPRAAPGQPSTPARAVASTQTSMHDKAAARQGYGQLPLSFVPNSGQMDRSVRYAAQGSGYTFAFAPTGARLSFVTQKQGDAVDLTFAGASRSAMLEARQESPGKVNYLVGTDPAGWRTDLPTYQELVYRDLWPGIDLAFEGKGGSLTYELMVQPGARIADIGFLYAGARGISVDRDGNLLIRTSLGTLTDQRPDTYQQIAGRKVSVPSRFVVDGGSRYGFKVGDYDASQPLVIDPGLVYSSFLGGSDFEQAQAIAIDTTGSAYVTGFTGSTNFPIVPNPGAAQPSYGGGYDAFVTKVNPTGTSFLYSTYLGGSAFDEGYGIAVDSAGDAYVAGTTASTNFPTTPGAFQTVPMSQDAFVTKLNPTGTTMLYSTRLGGNGGEQAFAIAIDATGSAYVTGTTCFSLNFPTTPGAYQTTRIGSCDVFVAKFNPTGTAPLLYSTLLGRSGINEGFGIAVDATLNAYIAGLAATSFPTTLGAPQTTYGGGNSDAFVTKLNATGSALLYSTYLGGTSADQAQGIAIDATGNAYLCGFTTSTNFPTTAGAAQTTYGGGSHDAFMTKVNAAGSAPFAYSTYLGGSADDEGFGISVDTAGNATSAGFTYSANFPTTPGAYQTTRQGPTDAFVTKLNATGTARLYSTYLGGTSYEFGFAVAVDPTGTYVTGGTYSANFPIVPNPGAAQSTYAGNGDAFITKLITVGSPTTVVLMPLTAINQVGTSHTVTATVRDAALQPVPGVTVRFTVTGANPTSGSSVTNTAGQATFTYIGTVAGLDTISAYADTNNNGTQDTGEPMALPVTKLWTPGPPVTLTLMPTTAVNPVGTQHCLTATVRDVYGNPVPNVSVVFTVLTAVATHASPPGASVMTNSAGQAIFCYTATLPGMDTIKAFADTNGNGVQDLTAIPPEPSAVATKFWIPPASSGTCKITSSGSITAINGDRGTFNGEVHVANGQASGHESYQDRGPLEPEQVDSTSLLAVVCPTPAAPTAMIYGHATVDGTGDFIFLITVTDGGNGGKNDSYGIIVSDGYISGQEPLQSGNVNIR